MLLLVLLLLSIDVYVEIVLVSSVLLVWNTKRMEKCNFERGGDKDLNVLVLPCISISH